MIVLEDLETVRAWMRRHGVRRVRCDQWEVELGPEPARDPEPPKLLSEADLKQRHLERKRAQYRLELGRTLTDAELERLP